MALQRACSAAHAHSQKPTLTSPNIEKPLLGSTTFQDLSIYISGGISILTLVAALSLMLRHLFCYTRPREQRQIIRIVFGPALFSILSFFSIWSYPDSLFLEPAQDLYEPVTLAGIFLLFTEFADPNEQTRESYFAQLENRKKRGGRFSFKKGYDILPGGCSRWYHVGHRGSSLVQNRADIKQSKYVAIFWYFIASVVIRIVEEATQADGRYCSSSFSPEFAHVWVSWEKPSFKSHHCAKSSPGPRDFQHGATSRYRRRPPSTTGVSEWNHTSRPTTH